MRKLETRHRFDFRRMLCFRHALKFVRRFKRMQRLWFRHGEALNRGFWAMRGLEVEHGLMYRFRCGLKIRRASEFIRGLKFRGVL